MSEEEDKGALATDPAFATADALPIDPSLATPGVLAVVSASGAAHARAEPRAVANEPRAVPNPRRRWLFAVTYAAYVVIYFSRKPLAVVKPLVQRDLGVSRDALGGVDTATFAAYALGQVRRPARLWLFS